MSYTVRFEMDVRCTGHSFKGTKDDELDFVPFPGLQMELGLETLFPVKVARVAWDQAERRFRVVLDDFMAEDHPEAVVAGLRGRAWKLAAVEPRRRP